MEIGDEPHILTGKGDSVYVGQWDALKEKMVWGTMGKEFVSPLTACFLSRATSPRSNHVEGSSSTWGPTTRRRIGGKEEKRGADVHKTSTRSEEENPVVRGNKTKKGVIGKRKNGFGGRGEMGVWRKRAGDGRRLLSGPPSNMSFLCWNCQGLGNPRQFATFANW